MTILPFPRQPPVRYLIPDAGLYTRECDRFGLRPEWLGQTVTLRGETWEVAGLIRGAVTFPVALRNLRTGQVDAWRREVVRLAFTPKEFTP